MRFIFSIIIFIFATGPIYADTITMKDKTKVKGLIVEEYVDRVIFSTADGEREIFKKEIDSIEYDAPEQNLFQIGREYEKKLQYEKATFYYKRALEINPEYKEARDAFLSSQAVMWREEEARSKKELEHRRMVLGWQESGTKEPTVAMALDKNELLKKNLGFELLISDGNFVVTKVVEGSGAYNAGIKEGDVLSAIWGRLVRYSKFEDVFNKLNIQQFSELKLSIERDIVLPRRVSDVSFKIGYEGLFIKEIVPGGASEKTGLKTGDIVTHIDKTPTRYMPLERAVELIKDKTSPFPLRIKRDIILKRTAP